MGFMLEALLFNGDGPAYGLLFIERMRGLGAIGGLDKAKKEASLAIRCGLYFSAGLSLLDAMTDRLGP